MIKVTQVPDTNIVEMEINGAISTAEFDGALEELDSAIKQYGKIKILERIGDLGTPPIPWSKFWDDIKFGFEHLKDITHAAVVADQGWVGPYVKLLNPLFKAQFRCFNLSELESAREWLSNAS